MPVSRADSWAAIPSRPNDSGAASKFAAQTFAAQIEAARSGPTSPSAAFLQSNLAFAAGGAAPAGQTPDSPSTKDLTGAPSNESEARGRIPYNLVWITSTAYNITPENPDMNNALHLGMSGATISSDANAIGVRAAKLVFAQLGHGVKITELYAGGPAIVEWMNNGEISVFRGKVGETVEYNLVPTKKYLPGQTKNQYTSLFLEVIIRTHHAGFELARSYKFNNYKSAKNFSEDFAKKVTLLSAYKPAFGVQGKFGIQSEFDAAYREHIKENGAAGVEFSGNYSPFWVKAYGSATFKGLEDSLKRSLEEKFPGRGAEWADGLTQKFLGNGPAAEAVLRGVGVYAEAGGSVWLKAGCSGSEPDLGQAELIEDLNPGAPLSCFGQAGVAWRVFGAVSLGNLAPISGLSDGAYTASAGLIFNTHHDLVQMFEVTEGRSGRLSPAFAQWFKDFRLNNPSGRFQLPEQIRLPNGARPEIGGMMAVGSLLDIEALTTRVELRHDLWGSPVDTLLYVYEGELKNTGPHARFNELAKRVGPELFNTKWERDARAFYEANVSGKPLSDQEWSQVLHDNLSWPLLNNLTFGSKGKWLDTYIKPRVGAYRKWGEISEKKLAERKAQLEKMTPAEIYDEYVKAGLRYPGVHITVTAHNKREEVGRLGVSLAEPGRTKRLEDKGIKNNPKDNPFGFYSLSYTGQTEDSHQLGAWAISHDAWPKADEILNDPVAGPAFVALMNQKAFPRKDTPGHVVKPTPLAVLVYHGVTPTREIERLREITGYKPDLSGIPGVYTIRAGDRNFDDIGRHALERLYAHPVSQAEAHSYGERIKKLNFGDLPPDIFENATIMLEDPKRAPNG